MVKNYCDKDTCIALEKLGYIGQGRCYYDLNKDKNELKHFGIQVLTTRTAKALNFVLAIHLYEAQKYLREKKDIHIEIYACAGGYIYELCKVYKPNSFSGGTTIYTPNDVNDSKLNDAGRYDDFETCLLEGIKEAIKLLKEEK